MIGIYLPTYKRPKRLAHVANNIHANTKLRHKIYFVVEPDDLESQKAAKDTQEEVVISEHPGNHTGAITTIYEKTDEPFFIMANDDFNFLPDWDVNSMKCMSDKIKVVALNEGMGARNTIFLIDRKYIEEQSGVIDQPNKIFCTEYGHNYADTEFWETALKRGVAISCPEAIIEHMHYTFGKAPLDETYQHTLTFATGDQRTFERRKHLWQT